MVGRLQHHDRVLRAERRRVGQRMLGDVEVGHGVDVAVARELASDDVVGGQGPEIIGDLFKFGFVDAFEESVFGEEGRRGYLFPVIGAVKGGT